MKNEFITALIMEISMSQDFIDPTEIIDTIYFGGGTPSLLYEEDLSSIVKAIAKKFIIHSNVEITLEANPDDINNTIVDSWKNIGINRLSLGLQSFNNEELTWMNRAHTAEEGKKSIEIILNHGITNLSVDLIFGGPLLSDEMLLENVQTIINYKIPHVSCYALTVEEKTLLHQMIQRKKTMTIDGEKQARHFNIVSDLLSTAQYEQYEISNYALQGSRSKHNSSYWKGKSYYGFGPSAHSFNGEKKRRWNVANNALYIKNILSGSIPYEEEVLSNSQQINEFIMISLRTKEGINVEKFEALFGKNQKDNLILELRPFILDNKVIVDNENIKLTKEGKLFADGIAAELFVI
jgi:oxygen-independent coproporphyrinogen-3 oxidase